MKKIINTKNLVPDETWQKFRKVRAVIENAEGCFAITIEGGKYIFPGGKCEENEDELTAIQREIKEETGIDFQTSEFHKVAELETMYDDILDYRTNSIRPRHTITTYYYVKTNKNINESEMSLTDGEIKEKFKIFFVDRDTLVEMLSKKPSPEVVNGKMFYEENLFAVDKILKR